MVTTLNRLPVPNTVRAYPRVAGRPRVTAGKALLGRANVSARHRGELTVHLPTGSSLCQGDGVRDAHDYDAIWRESGATLWRAIYAYAGGRRDVADDAVAEAFARVMARGADVRDPLAYLYRVAFRVASAELARGGKEVAEVPEIAITDPTQNGLPDLLRALKELTPAQRAAVYLHYRADMPVRQVAQLMGSSTAAVKVHLMRGRRRLASLLGEEDEQS
jgi:RNA polymerase sigma-70 factor (ECF subfamily)